MLMLNIISWIIKTTYYCRYKLTTVGKIDNFVKKFCIKWMHKLKEVYWSRKKNKSVWQNVSCNQNMNIISGTVRHNSYVQNGSLTSAKLTWIGGCQVVSSSKVQVNWRPSYISWSSRKSTTELTFEY